MIRRVAQPLDIAPQTPAMAALLERCLAGDGQAWRELYDGHFDFAWRTARRLGLPEEDADDAVQEAFEVAFLRLRRVTWGQFSTWLYRIVANVVSARLRRRRVREVFAALVGAGSRATSLEGQLEARHTLRAVEAVLRRLSREKRETFALFEIEGLSHEQIAALTGARVETVRTRLFYARREFAAHAQQMGVEP